MALSNPLGVYDQMKTKTITFKVTLKLDKEWAENQTKSDIVEYIKSKINSSLGFRGQVKEFDVV